MRKLLLSILLVVAFATTVRAQFRLASDGFVSNTSVVNDSTFIVDVNLFSDLTGSGYSPTNIIVGYRVFSQRGQLYRVNAIANATFGSATLTIIEVDNDLTDTEGLPIGQVQVFDPTNVEAIPQVPFGTTGATSVLQAAVVSYNSRVPTGGGSGGATLTEIEVQDYSHRSTSSRIYYASEIGTNINTPRVGDPDRPYSISDLVTQPLNNSELLVFSPGVITLGNTPLADIRKIQALPGSDINSIDYNILTMLSGGSYTFDFDEMSAIELFSFTTPVNFNLDLHIEKLNGVSGLGGNGWWKGSTGVESSVRLGDWVSETTGDGAYFWAPEKSFNFKAERVFDRRSTNIASNGFLIFSYRDAVNPGITMEADIDYYNADYGMLLGGNPSFQLGAKALRTTDADDITMSIRVGEYVDNTTGNGGTGAGTFFDADYIDIPTSATNGSAVGGVAVRPANSDGHIYNVRIDRGYLRSPVLVFPATNGGGGDNTTVNINLGQLTFRDRLCVGIDTDVNTTGRVSVRAENVHQISDEAMIKVGANNLDTITIQGFWRSDATTKPIIFTSEDLHLYDASLVLTSGTQNKIEANVPVTVYLYGSTWLTENDVNANVTLVYKGGTGVSDGLGDHVATQDLIVSPAYRVRGDASFGVGTQYTISDMRVVDDVSGEYTSLFTDNLSLPGLVADPTLNTSRVQLYAKDVLTEGEYRQRLYVHTRTDAVSQGRATSMQKRLLTEDDLLSGGGGSTVNQVYQNEAYAGTVTISYDPDLPNTFITAGGNIVLGVTNMTSGVGRVNVVLTADGQTVSLSGGTPEGNHAYPTTSGSVVRLRFTLENDGLVWYHEGGDPNVDLEGNVQSPELKTIKDGDESKFVSSLIAVNEVTTSLDALYWNPEGISTFYPGTVTNNFSKWDFRHVGELDRINKATFGSPSARLIVGVSDLSIVSMYNSSNILNFRSPGGAARFRSDLQVDEDFDMTNGNINNVADATADHQAVNRGQMNTAIAAGGGGGSSVTDDLDADFVQNQSATYVTVPDLSPTLEANSVYEISILFIHQGNANSDSRVQFVAPTGGEFYWQVSSALNGQGAFTTSTDAQLETNVTGGTRMSRFEGILITDSAGQFEVQYRRQDDDTPLTVDTKLLAGSVITYNKAQ